MKKILFFAVGATLALTSCNKNDVNDVMPNTDNMISFTTKGISTRVADNMFEGGDEIKVEAYKSSGDLHDAQVYSYTGNSAFDAETRIAQDGELTLSYAALYPTSATTVDFADDFKFAIAVDQRAAENYESSDMLVAKVDATSLATPELSFYHTMSVIDVEIEGATSLTNCAVSLTAKNNVNVNIADGSYEAEGSAVELTPLMLSNGFRLIVAPQELAAGKLATMTINGAEYTWTLPETSTLLSGYKYSYSWKVNEATGDSEVYFNGLINNWGDGEWNPGGSTGGSTGGNTGDGDGDNTGDQGGATPAFENFTMDSETMGYAGLQDAAGDKTLGEISWKYSGLSATDSFGSSYIDYETAGYIMNTTAFSGLTKIVVTGNGYVNKNLVVTVGTSESPTKVIASTSPDGSGWGATYEYTIPAGTTFIKFAANTESDHDAAISSVAFEFDGSAGGSGSTGGNTGGSTGGNTGDNTGDQGGANPTFADFTMDSETMGYAGLQDAAGDTTLGEISWKYSGLSATDQYGSSYIDYETAGYIMNTTAFSGLTKIVVTGNGYVNKNLVVTVGTSENPTNVIASTSPDGSGWGATYEYTIPAGTTFIKFAANTESDHDAAISSVAFDFE